MTSEEIGYDAFILRETVSGKVKNQQSLLRARARSVEGIYKMLVKNRDAMYEIDDRVRSMTKQEKVCDGYREAYAALTAFGYIFPDQHLDSSHPRTCQKCRFWKAEYDRKVAKVESKPGVLIDKVS